MPATDDDTLLHREFHLTVGLNFGKLQIASLKFPGMVPSFVAGFAFSGVWFSAEWLRLAGLRISPAIWNPASKSGIRREDRHKLLICAVLPAPFALSRLGESPDDSRER